VGAAARTVKRETDKLDDESFCNIGGCWYEIPMKAPTPINVTVPDVLGLIKYY
jgi:hypothetical protein